MLICTQKLDKNDPVLGFFHEWVQVLASQCSTVIVLCLEKGEYTLPSNVEVYSLGKEKGNSRIMRVARFYYLTWEYRAEYDVVFVHMNQIYVLLGAWLWRICGKKIGLWYAHGVVTLSLKIAVRWVDACFTPTEKSLRIATPKRHIVRHGVPVHENLSVNTGSLQSSSRLSIISVGRVSPVKNFEVIIEAVAILRDKGIDSALTIVGGVASIEQSKYLYTLQNLVRERSLENHVFFVGEKNNNEIVALCAGMDVFVNASMTGSLDKVMLEAMSASVVVLSCNSNLRDILAFDASLHAEHFIFGCHDAQQLATQLEWFLNLSPNERFSMQKKVRHIVEEQYSLPALIERIIQVYKTMFYEK